MIIQNHTLDEGYSIFQQPWWLEAVAPGKWEEVTIKEQGNTIARWPYIKKKKYFFDIITLPQLTQHLGPWIKPINGNHSKMLTRQQEIYFELIESLPSYDFLTQNFHHSITNWLPFYWKNYRQTTRYTYILDNIKNNESIWDNLRQNIRQDIRKAQKELEVTSNLGIDTLYNICKKTYHRQSKEISYSFDLLRRIDDACSSKSHRQLFFAQDKNGNIHAAIYVVLDSNCAYYLLGGGDPALRSSGAHSLLVWEAIRYASQFVDQFDFEGSMVQSIERFFRSFGAKQVPYFHITHAQKKLNFLKRIIL